MATQPIEQAQDDYFTLTDSIPQANWYWAAMVSIAASAQWLANFAITQSFPSMSRWSLSGSYVIYACFAALSIPFIVFLVKETKGKALEEMG